MVPFANVPSLPEPMEQTRYAVLVPAAFGLLLLFAVVFWLYRQHRPSDATGLGWLLQAPEWLLGTLVLVALAQICKHNGYLYLQYSVFFKHKEPYWYLLIPLAFWLYLKARHYTARFVVRVLLLLLACLVLGAAVANALIPLQSPPPPFHFNPMVYPIALFRSGVPIGGDALSVYGLFPVYVVPIMKLFGQDVTTICLIFAALVAVSYIALALAVHWCIRNPFLKICVAFSLPYMSYLVQTPQADPYYQYWPIRILFPSLLLAALAWAVRNPIREPLAIGVAAGLSVTSLFWNVDSGLSCCIAFLAYMTIRAIHRWTSLRQRSWLGALTVVAEAAVRIATGAVPAVSLFYISYWLQVQSWPEVGRAIATTALFAKVGYTFMPMADGLAYWHIWLLALGACALSAFRLFIRTRKVRSNGLSPT